ncbi:MAG: helix-turn-helix domain-containing protein [Egibacteraceae bacterium]
MTVGEVARLLRVGESTVRSWIARSEVPFIALPGGDYRIPGHELFRSLRSNVDTVSVLHRLSERLQAIDEPSMNEEIATVRAMRSQRRA